MKSTCFSILLWTFFLVNRFKHQKLNQTIAELLPFGLPHFWCSSSAYGKHRHWFVLTASQLSSSLLDDCEVMVLPMITCVLRRPSWTPEAQPKGSCAIVWLNFWFSTRFVRKKCLSQHGETRRLHSYIFGYVVFGQLLWSHYRLEQLFFFLWKWKSLPWTFLAIFGYPSVIFFSFCENIVKPARDNTRCVRENFFQITYVKMEKCVREKYNLLFAWNFVKFNLFLYPWKKIVFREKYQNIFPSREKENPPMKKSKNASVKTFDCPWKWSKKCAWKPLFLPWKKAENRFHAHFWLSRGKKTLVWTMSAGIGLFFG